MMPAPSSQTCLPAGKATPKSQSILTKRNLALLQDISQLRVVSAKDIALLRFSPRSLTHAREQLNRLAGNADYKEGEYLYRFLPPRITRGNPERAYVLGSKGAQALTEITGTPVSWYCEPSKLKSFSFPYLRHSLFLTRIIAALTYFARTHPRYFLRDCRLCYELARTRLPATDDEDTKPRFLPVIADAWAALGPDGQGTVLWIEADCGTEMRKKYQAGLRARIAFLENDYARVFGTRAVIMCFITTGQMEGYKDQRRQALQAWTQAVLVKDELEDWADVFQFAAVGYMELFTSSLFDAPVWYSADSQTPVPLLTTSPSKHP